MEKYFLTAKNYYSRELEAGQQREQRNLQRKEASTPKIRAGDIIRRCCEAKCLEEPTNFTSDNTAACDRHKDWSSSDD